jgi:hypothetical protein
LEKSDLITLAPEEVLMHGYLNQVFLVAALNLGLAPASLADSSYDPRDRSGPVQTGEIKSVQKSDTQSSNNENRVIHRLRVGRDADKPSGLKAVLKKEFDSSIHPITSNSR